MTVKKFTDFTLKTAATLQAGDYFVGYNAAGTLELRITFSDLLKNAVKSVNGEVPDGNGAVTLTSSDIPSIGTDIANAVNAQAAALANSTDPAKGSALSGYVSPEDSQVNLNVRLKLAEQRNIQDFKRAAESDWTQASQRAAAASVAESVNVIWSPRPTPYYLSDTSTFNGTSANPGVNFGFDIQAGAKVRATPAIAGKPMFVLTGDSAGYMVGFRVGGKGILDCGNYASKGVWVKTGARGFVDDLTILDATLIPVHIGDAASPGGGSEVHCRNLQPYRTEGANNDPNSIGVYYEVITDSNLINCIPVGYRIGIKTIPNVRMFACHPWAKKGHGPMRYAFWVEGAQSALFGCCADTPHPYNFDGSLDPTIPDVFGYFLNGYSINLYDPVVYLEQNNAADNTATGIWINHTDGLFGSIINPSYGGGTTKKYKRYIGQLGQTTRLTNTTQIGAVTGGAFAYDSNNMSDYGRTTVILGGGVLAADGTVGQPRYAFNLEETTGLYRAAAGDVRMSVLGQDGFIFNANTVIQRNGSNAQTHLIYNTYTDASNYERGFFRWSGNVLQIGTENAGTGVTREVRFYTNSISRWGVSGSGALYPSTTAVTDIGFASNAVRTYYGAGGMTLGTASKSADYTLTANDYVVKFDASAAARTATLPTTPNTGQIYVVKKIDASANTVTVASNGKSIDGAVSVVISTQWGIWRGQYDGTTWNTI